MNDHRIHFVDIPFHFVDSIFAMQWYRKQLKQHQAIFHQSSFLVQHHLHYHLPYKKDYFYESVKVRSIICVGGLTLGRKLIRVMEDLNNQLQQDSFLTFQMGSSIPIHQQQSSCEYHRFLLFYQDKDRNQKFWHHKQSYCRPRKCVSIRDYLMLLNLDGWKYVSKMLWN